MRKMSLAFMAMAVCYLLISGCAPKAYHPVDLNPPLKSGKLIQKTDNFIVLFDQSASMNDQLRYSLAKDTTRGMMATIPEIELNAGLRTFRADATELVYGMDPLDKEAFMKTVNAFRRGSGRTPLGRSIAAGGEDLKPLSGQSAMIIISDFEDISGVDDIRPKSVMENVGEVKEQYGDRLCIYTIQVGQAPDGKILAQEIADGGKCGFAVNADELKTPEKMASFVERVFLGAPPPVAQEEAKPGEIKAEAAAPVETKAEAAAPMETSVAAVAALENIHFDFDKSSLRPGDRDILKKHADWLSQNKDYSVLIEGYCDERGSTEYNLALGQRRADSAMKYLIDLGIEESRLKTISYGKERPLDPGHDEAAWAKNRCDQFMLTPIK